MLPPSPRLFQSPSFIASAIHNGSALRLCPRDDIKRISMRRSCVVKSFLSAKTGQGDYIYSERLGDNGSAEPWRINPSYGQSIVSSCGQISRKRKRTSLRMTNRREEEITGNADNSKIDRNNVEGRRKPIKLSPFEKLVDKALLSDGLSLDSESSIPVTFMLLTIITTLSPILPNIVDRVLFIGLFLLFSLPALYPSLLLWDDDDGDEETSEFKIYFLSGGYLGALFLTCLMKPFDFEMAGVVPAAGASLVPTGIVLVALLGLLSNTGLISLNFIDDEDQEVDDDDEDGALSISAEEILMDSWDQKFQRDELSDDRR